MDPDFHTGCPTEGRRTPRELYAKLFIVNFAVLYSYAHLLHKRREPYVVSRVIICFFWPATAIWQLLLPLLGVVIEAVRTKGSRVQIKQAIAITLGTYAQPEEHYNVLGDRVQEAVEPVIGDLFTGALLLVQSITSIWLFRRRHLYNAVMLYDMRILHLALAGLSVGLLLCLLGSRPPRYPQARSHWLKTLRPPQTDDGASNIELVFFDLLAASTMTSIFYSAGLGINLLNTSMIWSVCAALALHGNTGERVIFIFTGICATFAITSLPISLYMESEIKGWMTGLRILRNTMIGVLAIAVLPNLTATGWYDYISVFWFDEGISRVSNLVHDQPCPVAWSDPAAAWVVWLA